MPNEHQKNQKGFTLIELLVVISIISLLASIVLVALNNARIKGRDAKRVADLKQIRTALDLYLSDNGHYPISNCAAGAAWTAFDSANFYSTNGICPTIGAAVTAPSITAAMNPYMKGAKDPKFIGSDSGYLYLSDDGKEFNLMVYKTPENMNNFDKSVINYNRCGDPVAHIINLVDGQCIVVNGVGGINSIQFSSPGGLEH